MAVEARPELVGKRFLCVSGDEPPEISDIDRWPWRSGVIRAVNHRDSDNPDLTVSETLTVFSLWSVNVTCKANGRNLCGWWLASEALLQAHRAEIIPWFSLSCHYASLDHSVNLTSFRPNISHYWVCEFDELCELLAGGAACQQGVSTESEEPVSPRTLTDTAHGHLNTEFSPHSKAGLFGLDPLSSFMLVLRLLKPRPAPCTVCCSRRQGLSGGFVSN